MEEPVTRRERVLHAIAERKPELLPKPVTREERFLYALAVEGVDTPNPITREERYLKAIDESISSGSGGGGEDTSSFQFSPYHDLIIINRDLLYGDTGNDPLLASYSFDKGSGVIAYFDTGINIGNLIDTGNLNNVSFNYKDSPISGLYIAVESTGAYYTSDFTPGISELGTYRDGDLNFGWNYLVPNSMDGILDGIVFSTVDIIDASGNIVREKDKGVII